MDTNKKKTKFLVIWHYIANYGHTLVEAETPKQAKDLVWNGRKDIEYFVIEPSKVKHFPKRRD